MTYDNSTNPGARKRRRRNHRKKRNRYGKNATQQTQKDTVENHKTNIGAAPNTVGPDINAPAESFFPLSAVTTAAPQTLTNLTGSNDTKPASHSSSTTPPIQIRQHRRITHSTAAHDTSNSADYPTTIDETAQNQLTAPENPTTADLADLADHRRIPNPKDLEKTKSFAPTTEPWKNKNFHKRRRKSTKNYYSKSKGSPDITHSYPEIEHVNNTELARPHRSGSRSTQSAHPSLTPSSVAKRKEKQLSKLKYVTKQETSAGGLIIRGLGAPLDELETALIGRLDRRGRLLWSIPKGHIELGETAEIAAEREILEETGLVGKVIGKLGEINYSFTVNNFVIRKTVHHFILVFQSGELSSEDPEVTSVAWVKLLDLTSRLTYSDERKLFTHAKKFLSQLDTNPNNIMHLIEKVYRDEPNSYERTAAENNQHRIEHQPLKRVTRSGNNKNSKKSVSIDRDNHYVPHDNLRKNT